QRISELGEMLGCGRQRALVEADLGVSQILVVDQQQVGQPLADHVTNGGALAGDIELDTPAELESFGLAVVKAHCKSMWPDCWKRRRRFLLDLEGTDGIASRGGQRAQRIETGCLQPQF